jgi:hypothetical protein
MPASELMSVPDRVRNACARVAGLARSVQVDGGAIGAYAGALARAEPAPVSSGPLIEGDRETRAAFVLCLDAINFGSGWWPTIRKRPGCSGYSTVEAGLVDRFREEGAWSAAELSGSPPPRSRGSPGRVRPIR